MIPKRWDRSSEKFRNLSSPIGWGLYAHLCTSYRNLPWSAGSIWNLTMDRGTTNPYIHQLPNTNGNSPTIGDLTFTSFVRHWCVWGSGQQIRKSRAYTKSDSYKTKGTPLCGRQWRWPRGCTGSGLALCRSGLRGKISFFIPSTRIFHHKPLAPPTNRDSPSEKQFPKS